VLKVFGQLPLVGVRVGESYLSYDQAVWPEELVAWKDARDVADDVAGLIFALGTISFVGEVLEHLDVDCRRVYSAPLHVVRQLMGDV
jgi:dihydrofolate synthase/folylpolyglutamate synthase